MASVWFEPGSNHTGDLSFWTSTSGTVASATDQSLVGPRAIKLSTGNPATIAFVQKDGILSDAGRRITIPIYLDTLPGANNGTMLEARNGSGNVVLNLAIQTNGQLRASAPGITGVNSTNGLTAGAWHRIAFSYVVTNSTTFEIKVYLDDVLEITITNSGTLTNTGSANLRLAAPALFGVTRNLWIGCVYVDDGTDRADPGDIRCAAKRPNANGGTNTFGVTTSTTNSGYGTGNSIYVNERPLATTGQRRINNNTATGDENFAIENVSTGDVNLTGKTIVARMAWAHGSGVSTDTLWDNGAAAVPPAAGGGAFTGTAGIRYKITDTSSYPTSGSAVGMGRPTGNSTDCIMNECGMVIAYLVVSAQSLSMSVISAGNTAAAPTTKYLVSLPTKASGASLAAPTLAVGAVSVTMPTRASGLSMSAPSVQYVVALPTRASTVSLFSQTLTVGAVTVSMPTRSSTLTMSAAALSYALVLGTRASAHVLFAQTVDIVQNVAVPAVSATAALNAPSTSYRVSLPAAAAGTSFFAPTVTPGAVGIALTTRASAYQVFDLTVTAGAVTLGLPSVGSGNVRFSMSLTVGAVTVQLPTRASGATVSTPTITVGAVTVALPTTGSAYQAFSPTVDTADIAVVVSTVVSGNARFAPSVTAGAVTLALPTRSSGVSMASPTLAYRVMLATRGSGQLLFSQTVAPGAIAISLSARASTLTTASPSVSVGAVTLALATRSSTLQVFSLARVRDRAVFPSGVWPTKLDAKDFEFVLETGQPSYALTSAQAEFELAGTGPLVQLTAHQVEWSLTYEGNRDLRG